MTLNLSKSCMVTDPRGCFGGSWLAVTTKTSGPMWSDVVAAHMLGRGFADRSCLRGELVNTWTGHAEGIPPFVMMRTAPDVTGAVMVGATGREYPLTLSEVIEPFHLRFGAAPCEGESVIELRIESPAH